jgi:hypothetical protein
MWHNCVTHNSFRRNSVTHNSFTHSFATHDSFTHNPSTRDSFTHNSFTHKSVTQFFIFFRIQHCHCTALSHNLFFTISLVSFLPFPSHFHSCFVLLEEVDMLGYPVFWLSVLGLTRMREFWPTAVGLCLGWCGKLGWCNPSNKNQQGNNALRRA